MAIQNTLKNLCIKEPYWLQQRRYEAFRKFESLPKQNFKYGINILMNAADLNVEEINHNESVQGLSAECNDSRIEIMSLHEAFEKHKDLTEKYFGSLILEEDKIIALHMALWNKGLFIKI